MGPSGSGKSTLMHCLAGLDTATAGSVQIGGVELTELNDKALTLLRRRRIGFVFQSFNLLPTLTAEQNILLPLDLAGLKPPKQWWDQVIEVLDLGGRLKHRPGELSGGQQQRVACARALMSRPEVVFADEPTGNLDSRSGAEVLAFLRMSVRELGQTVVMVTHDTTAACAADRVVFLADACLRGDLLSPTPDSVTAQLRMIRPDRVAAGE
jgi:putative ABC transport system ATP-binding protein